MRGQRAGAVVGFASAVLLSAAVASAQGGTQIVGTLWAGQDIDAGTYSLQVSAGCGELVVQLVPDNGWELAGYHIAIVDDPARFPVNNGGNPIVGRFHWKASFPPTDDPQTLTWLADHVVDPVVCGDTVYVAIHAEMVMRNDVGAVLAEEGAWGGPDARVWNPHGLLPDGFSEFPGARWDYFFELPWQGAPTPTPTPTYPPPTGTPIVPSRGRLPTSPTRICTRSAW